QGQTPHSHSECSSDYSPEVPGRRYYRASSNTPIRFNTQRSSRPSVYSVGKNIGYIGDALRFQFSMGSGGDSVEPADKWKRRIVGRCRGRAYADGPATEGDVRNDTQCQRQSYAPCRSYPCHQVWASL